MDELTFEAWWNANYRDVATERADFTYGEEVWKAATRAAWIKVFNVVSDMKYTTDKELIMQLEAARDVDGCGPETT